MPRTSMRLQPNRRASSDHTPGPIIASAMPMPASRTFRQGSPDSAIKLHSEKAATRHPDTGVHRPASRRTPPITAAPSRAAGSMDCAVRNPGSPTARATLPATRRNIKRPAPGQPWANVEKRRRRSIFCNGPAQLRPLILRTTASFIPIENRRAPSIKSHHYLSALAIPGVRAGKELTFAFARKWLPLNPLLPNRKRPNGIQKVKAASFSGKTATGISNCSMTAKNSLRPSTPRKRAKPIRIAVSEKRKIIGKIAREEDTPRTAESVTVGDICEA